MEGVKVLIDIANMTTSQIGVERGTVRRRLKVLLPFSLKIVSEWYVQVLQLVSHLDTVNYAPSILRKGEI